MRKLMAVVVVIIMIGFIGGSYIRQITQRKSWHRQTIAHFNNNEKITNYDRGYAQQELDTLRMLGADYLLRNISVPEFGTRDLQPFFLGELLFSDRRISSALTQQTKQMISRVGYRISDSQLYGLYKRQRSDIYWLLLDKEAQEAGIRVTNEKARNELLKILPELAKSIPQLKGITYTRLLNSIVNPPAGANRQGIPEEQVLRTFGKLLAVLDYAKLVCSNEDITAAQIRHNASYREELVDLELVRIKSSIFSDSQQEPGGQETEEHFEKYKKYFAGEITEDNPYGFGYKLDDRISLEYIAVKLDDVTKIITKPTQDDLEDFYRQYKNQLTEQVLSDPDDPNSPIVERTRSYAEVANVIARQLLQTRINNKAERILQDAKSITEAAFEDIDTEVSELTAEQYKKLISDYKTAADKVAEKHNIKVYSGQTDFVTADDMLKDEHLGKLFLTGSGRNFVGLTRIAFAVDEIASSELGPFEVPNPRMYENIGPLKDVSGEIMVLARITKVQKAAEPESINQTLGKRTLVLDETPQKEDAPTIKDNVINDLKSLAAMDTTKSKAQELIDLVGEKGWDKAIDEFNTLYGNPDKQPDEPNVFELELLENLQRLSDGTLEILSFHNTGKPTARFLLAAAKQESIFMDKIFSLVPDDSNTIEKLPMIMEFKPDLGYCCLKSVKIRRLEEQQFETNKARRIYHEGFIQAQSLAAVHFNPENILKRMNFKPVQEKKDTATPATKKDGDPSKKTEGSS
jgi:hypothetical protein